MSKSRKDRKLVVSKELQKDIDAFLNHFRPLIKKWDSEKKDN